MQSIIMQIGKERNMTFPKKVMERLEVSPDALENAQGVFLLERLITSDGNIIPEKEIDHKMEKQKNVV
tara:strand:- start:20 stop:223 length:204 start_codon:yes stop_codon:yes gene_type:complete